MHLFFKKNFSPLTITFLVLSVLIVGTPQKSNGQVGVVTDPGHTVVSAGNAVSSGVTAGKSIADKIADGLNVLARQAAKAAIRRITAGTVNWINSGFKGNPAFVTDPGQFFLNVGDEAASKLISSTKLNALCSPFKAQIRLALVKNYLSETGGENYTCTLSKIKNNYEGFMKNFNQGGWEGWFEVTQNDQNNPYGAYLSAKNSLSINVGTQKATYQKQLDQGNGFLSFKKCKPGQTVTEDKIREWSDADNAANGTDYADYKVGDCRDGQSQTVTPGGVIEKQLENALGTGIKQLELARSADEIVSALVTQLFERVLQAGKGLLSNDNPNDPDNTLPLPEPEIGLPAISLLGLNPTYIQLNSTSAYHDAGAVATDVTDGDITDRIETSGEVNTLVAGTYTITYNVTNSLGKEATPVTRRVVVGDDSVQPGSGSDDCTVEPTPEQAAKRDEIVAYMLPKLNAIVMNPVIDPPLPASYTDAVKAVIADTNSRYPEASAAYYPGANNIGMPLNYILGPTATIVDSNQTHTPPTKWDNYNRVYSPSCGGSTGGGTTGNGSDTTRHSTPTTGIKPDLSNVDIVGPGSPRDVGIWSVTSSIQEFGFKPSGNDSTMRIKHTKNGVWAPVNADGAMQEATLWIFFYINGKWTTTGSERLRPNQTDKPEVKPSKISTDWFYNNSWSPMGGDSGYSPKPGEYVGIMVTSGNTRTANVSAERERSNVVLVKWPTDTASGNLPFVTLPL